MIDETAALKKRFDSLRAEEERWIPRFRVSPPRPRHKAWRLIAVAGVVMVLIGGLAASIAMRSRRTAFSLSDRVAVQSIDAWRPPTAFLMRTPGSDILTTTPAIPDLAAVLTPAKGPSR